MLIVAGIMLYALTSRSDLALNVLHDRNPLYVRLSDGSIRNAYTIRVINKRGEEQRVALAVEGLDGAEAEVVGAADDMTVTVGPDRTAEARLLVTLRAAPSGSHPLTVTARSGAGRSAVVADVFEAP
jgi:polyferredoxin